MVYYKVKKEYDNRQKINVNYWKTRRNYKYDIWIGGELYTPGEITRLRDRGIKIIESYFDIVEIPKTETYFFFGARFEKGV